MIPNLNFTNQLMLTLKNNSLLDQFPTVSYAKGAKSRWDAVKLRSLRDLLLRVFLSDFTTMGLIFLSSKNETANTPLGVSREIYSISIDIYVCEYYLIDSWPTKTASKARRSSFFCSNYLPVSLTSWHFLCPGGSFMFPSFVLSLNSTLMEDMPHFSIIFFWFYVC